MSSFVRVSTRIVVCIFVACCLYLIASSSFFALFSFSVLFVLTKVSLNLMYFSESPNKVSSVKHK